MKVELVSKTIGVGKYKDLNSEEIIAAIARHGKIKEDNGRLVKYLMDNKHLSPLDEIYFGFEIETSRAIGRHILRHCSISHQEHSQRYSDRVSFEPIELRKEHLVNRQSSTEVFEPELGGKSKNVSLEITNCLNSIQSLYQQLIKAGVAKECARMILPECTTTTMTETGSLRSWLSFLNVRCDEHAQKEIQEIALLIGELLEVEMPNIMGAIDWRNGMFL